MTRRLFDGNAAATVSAKATQNRVDVRRRAEEVDDLLSSYEENDEKSKAMASMLGQVESVVAISYKTYREVGSKWVIEHAVDGDDYVYQVFPIKEPALDWQGVFKGLVAALDVIFPKSLRIDYSPPNEQFNIRSWTIRLNGVTKLPGWQKACTEQALKNLSWVEAW